MAGETLIRLIQDAGKPDASKSTDLMYGEVTSVSPLKVRVDNRFEVDEQFLILSALVKETIITLPAHSHNVAQQTTSEYTQANHSHIVPSHETQDATLPSHSHSIPSNTTGSDGDPTHTHSVPSSTSGNAGGGSHKHSVAQQSTQDAGGFSHTHTTAAQVTSENLTSIVLWRGLKVNDKVRLLRVSNGQMFYIIEREEGVV